MIASKVDYCEHFLTIDGNNDMFVEKKYKACHRKDLASCHPFDSCFVESSFFVPANSEVCSHDIILDHLDNF